MKRREMLTHLLGLPLALFAGPAVFSSAKAETLRPRRQKPYIDSNPHEPDYDCCPHDRICLDTGSPTVTVTIDGVTR